MEYFYIYNPEQANFFVQNGLEVVAIGKGKYNDVYVKFNRTEKEEKVFTKWVERKRK